MFCVGLGYYGTWLPVNGSTRGGGMVWLSAADSLINIERTDKQAVPEEAE